MIQVIVIYALPNIQYIYEINIKSGSTVKDAVIQSNLLKKINHLSLHSIKVGIYNKLVHLDSKIKNGDQIEIYRNLITDPKERRRKKYFFLKKIK